MSTASGELLLTPAMAAAYRALIDHLAADLAQRLAVRRRNRPALQRAARKGVATKRDAARVLRGGA